MRALLDVNVLIALLDADHISHEEAQDWFRAHARDGWASCPITQNGCVRVMASAGYPNPVPVSATIARLGEACAHSAHEFWPDDMSILSRNDVDATRLHGPRQLTNAYLLALAAHREGCFVTFDRAVPLAAALKAAPRHLVTL
jgi:uncharacterized protein